MNLWIKWSAGAHKDAIIASLTDTQFRAFVTILEIAKEMRKGASSVTGNTSPQSSGRDSIGQCLDSLPRGC